MGRAVPSRRTFLRLTLGVAAIVVACLAIFVLRAMLIPSRQLRVARAAPANLDESGAVERFAASLRYQTVSNPADFDVNAFRGLHRHLEESFPRVHETLETEIVEEFSLLYRWKGSDPSAAPILLMSHLDVVSAAKKDGWTHDPWNGVVAGGFIWGRGALDVKCGALSILEAAEHLLQRGFQPRSDVYFAFGHDEETGGVDGNAKIALLLRQRGVRFRWVLDEGGAIVQGVMPGLDRPLAVVGVAEKGHVSVLLTAHGPPGHASMPPPETAVTILADAVRRVQENQRPADLAGPVDAMLDYVAPETTPLVRLVLSNRDVFEPLLLHRFRQTPSLNALVRTTTAFTMTKGGKAENVLPATASAVVNFRLLPGADPDSPGDLPKTVLEHVQSVVDDERIDVEPFGSSAPPSRVSNHQSEGFRSLQTAIGQIDPEIVVAPGLAVVATDSRHYERLAENTFRFLPLRLTGADLERIHGVDERIAVANYLEMVRFTIVLLENDSHVANH